MAIIKKIDDQNKVLAQNTKIDHSQLSGTNSYGAHPISAIRKLPEKLSALKNKTQELDQMIKDHNTEADIKIKELEEKDIQLTERTNEIEEHAKQINLTVDENYELEFTNYDGQVTNFRSGHLMDEDTITTRNEDGLDKITLKKVYHDETTLKGLGTQADPLAIKYPVDENTLITDQENGYIYSTAIKDDKGKITPQDIRDSNESYDNQIAEINNHLDQHDQDIIRIDEVNEIQQDQIDDLLTRTQGMGGYLNAYDFETSTPTQEELTQYAIQDIGNISEQSEIYNGTKVKNLYDNHIWVFNDDPDLQNPWSDQGTDAIIADANNDGLHGLVTGSYEDLEGSIDIKGHITINGLKEKLNSIDSVNNDLQNQITQEVEDRIEGDNTLQTNLTNEINRAQEAEKTLQENIDNLESYSNETFETKIDANTSHTELENKIIEARGIAVKYLGTYIIGNSYRKYDLVSYGDYYYISLKEDNIEAPSIGVTNENWECISINSLTTKTIQVTEDDNKLFILGDKGTSDPYQSIYRPSNVYVENNVVYDGRGKLASDIELDELYQKVIDEAVKADEQTITRNEDTTITTIGVKDYINNIFKSAESLIKGTNIIVLGAND